MLKTNNCFKVEGLREQIDESHGLNLVAAFQESLQVARQRGGIARYDIQLGRRDAQQLADNVLAQARARRIGDDEVVLLLEAGQELIDIEMNRLHVEARALGIELQAAHRRGA